MSRQHSFPILIGASGDHGTPLMPYSLAGGSEQVSEAAIQQLIQDHPNCLPITEIDSLFVNPVPICTELNTPAGPIYNFMVTPTGLPVLVECKLWRNPEARREVVGQILDYAKELSRWTSSDLQREASRRVGRTGNILLEMVRAAGHMINEADFNDALTSNLRRGRFLLLIVGDGIREGVEAIADYLQAHAGLHFTLGLVEMPIYRLPSGQRLVVPRVLARTQVIIRTVVAVPEGMAVVEDDVSNFARESDPDIAALANERQQFWKQFLKDLVLDDPEQAVGKPPKQGYLTLTMPAPGGTSWLTIYRDVAHDEVGVFLSYARDSLGERINDVIADDRDTVVEELGGTARITNHKGRERFVDSFSPGSLDDPQARERAFAWLRGRTNDFVNVFRPRVRAAALDLTEG